MCFSSCSAADRRSERGAEEQPGHHHSGLLHLPQPVGLLQSGRHQRQERLPGDHGQRLSLTDFTPSILPSFVCFSNCFLLTARPQQRLLQVVNGAGVRKPSPDRSLRPTFSSVFPARHERGRHIGGWPRHGAADRGRNPALGEHHLQGGGQLRCRGE